MRVNVRWDEIRLWALVAAIVVLAVLIALARVPFLNAPPLSEWARLHLPLIMALLGVLMVFATALLVQGKNDFLLLFQSEGDKKLSVSKLQLYVWTSVIAFSYIYIVAWNYGVWGAMVDAHQHVGGIPAPLAFPPTVLLALGLSVGTFALAKGTAVGYGSGAAANQPQAAPAPMTPGLVASDVSGTPDITKVQMLAWTAIAAVVYIVDTVAQITYNQSQSAGLITSLPSIDYAMLVLTGVAQGTYIGNKMIVPRGPILTGVAPATTVPGGSAHVFGSGFGTTGTVLVDGAIATAVLWSDTDVAFTVPQNKPSTGTPYAPGDRARLTLIVNGTRSANDLTLPF